MLPTIFDSDCGDSFASCFSLSGTKSTSISRANTNNSTSSGGISKGASNTSLVTATTSESTLTLNSTATAVPPALPTAPAPAAANAKVNIDRATLDAAHYMMRPFVLRRVKTEVEEKLPPKLETLIRCPLSDMQRFWIKGLLLRESGAFMGQFGETNAATTSAGANSADEPVTDGEW